ncbi:hypothetical protein QUC31_004938 [Theobroma cacao]|uniref:Multidrug resistance protein ABC transporter family protein, putative n=1 Tax=Theobroma cacao TaxID=3641 RepID=A0A061DZ20_THECC|nr:Multidrug resistance protein ABC transporter family protein, putative [Theobroma cacao]WRX09048.1 PADRE domain - like 5 [Theobroma cacao]
MGNYISTVTCRPTSDTAGKVILWDGSVQQFNWPLTAAELMLEHPQQVVVEFHSAVNEKRPIPLPADSKLDMNKVYVMLPVKRGKPTTLSSEEARRVLLSANSVLRSKSILSSSKFLPLFAKICPANIGEIVGQRFPLQKRENVCEKPEEVRCLTEFDLLESLEGRPEYLNRQYSGKGWKPSLDTIKEKKVERKVPHWLF